MRPPKLPRPLPRASEEIQAWSSALSSELSGWPRVSTRPMFGMTAFYRGGRIFACLPHKRAFYDPHTVIFKFDPLPPKLAERAQRDSRISGARTLLKRAGWLSFEINGAGDLRDVLWWFHEAYCAAGARPSKRRKAGAGNPRS